MQAQTRIRTVQQKNSPTISPQQHSGNWRSLLPKMNISTATSMRKDSMRRQVEKTPPQYN
ncbi:conserved hypothetical protein [Ricinus communis]|uniref:Uncharacterized protein n=1 Tax=Ricinus communis TaxID=3988 RepID=B9RT43_RICCO|nr:conserved hypothetical protein [Ricinus communis]